MFEVSPEKMKQMKEEAGRSAQEQIARAVEKALWDKLKELGYDGIFVPGPEITVSVTGHDLTVTVTALKRP